MRKSWQILILWALIMPNAPAKAVSYSLRNCTELIKEILLRTWMDYQDDRRLLMRHPVEREIVAGWIALHRLTHHQWDRSEVEYNFLTSWRDRYREIHQTYLAIARQNIVETRQAWATRMALRQWRPLFSGALSEFGPVNSAVRQYFAREITIAPERIADLTNVLATMQTLQDFRLDYLADAIEHALTNPQERLRLPAIEEGFIPGRHIIHLPDAQATNTRVWMQAIRNDDAIPTPLRSFIEGELYFLRSFRLPPTIAHRDLADLIDSDWRMPGIPDWIRD